MKHLVLLLISISGALTLAFPGNPVNRDTLRTYQLEDSVVVVANRYSLSLRSISNSVDILAVEEGFELASHSILQLADLLSPNAFVLEKKVIGYGVGTYGSGNIYLRGMGGKPNSGVLVLINGRPDFMGIFGHPLPDVYGLSGINQVEIIKGPSSTLFGSNAMGGAINLVTEDPSASEIRTELLGGSFNTYSQSLNLAARFKSTSFRFIAGHQRTDGHIDSSGFEGWNLMGRMGYRLNSNWGMALEGRYVPYQFDDPFMGADAAALGRYGKIRRGMMDFSIDGAAGNLKNSFHLYSNLGHHRFNDGFESHDFSMGLSSYQHYKRSPRIQISFGLDALYFGGRARNVVFPQAPPSPGTPDGEYTGGIYYRLLHPGGQGDASGRSKISENLSGYSENHSNSRDIIPAFSLPEILWKL